MIWNPFDVQKCSIKFALSRRQSQFIKQVSMYCLFRRKLQQTDRLTDRLIDQPTNQRGSYWSDSDSKPCPRKNTYYKHKTKKCNYFTAAKTNQTLNSLNINQCSVCICFSVVLKNINYTGPKSIQQFNVHRFNSISTMKVGRFCLSYAPNKTRRNYH